MPNWQPPHKTEIDKKLRDDFRRLLKDYGITTEETDPILAVLFRSFATQIADIYGQAAESIPLAILDELMAGLGMPERRARPAQTVLRLALKAGREVLAAGTELIGEASTKEKLTFALDAEIGVSAAQLSFVAIYQNGLLQLHQGTQLAPEVEAARPSFDPVPVDLGPGAAIYLAVDCPDEEHLSRHGFYFELLPEAKDLHSALQREVWALLDEEGAITAEGLLRPVPGNAGVRQLQWFLAPASTSVSESESGLLEGFFGSRNFLLPDIPDERRFLCQAPQKMSAPLQRILAGSAEARTLLERPRVWLRIGVPREIASIGEDLIRVVLHCVTASNVEILNQTIDFAEQGRVIPISTGSARARQMVRVISLKGEQGSEYLPNTAPGVSKFTGAYRARHDLLEIEPACNAREIPDKYANVRLLLCNGSLGNNVGAGGITTFLHRAKPRDLELRNLNSAVGGTDGESLPDAKNRFAEALLARQRPVTYPDLEAIAKSFEPKIQQVRAEPRLERAADGLHRIQQITITLDRNSFTLPEPEAAALQRELELDLQDRSLLGLKVRVAVEWK